MIALDTETTGMDFFHGAMPFFISTCDELGVQRYWEWTVCPFTRRPDIPPHELEEVRSLVMGADHLVLQNAKFDAHALSTIGIEPFSWDIHDDTLLAGHLLASNEPHDLTEMAVQYLGHDIKPLEKRLEGAVRNAREFVRRHLPEWRIAKEGDSVMPSAKEETWRFDYWLPRTLMLWWASSEVPGTKALLDEHDEWWTVLRNYSNEDTRTTLCLWQAMRQEIDRRHLWDQYLEARKLPEIFYDMERRGVTVHRKALRETRLQFYQDSEVEKSTCREIAAAMGYDLKLPKSGMNGSLNNFCFDHRRVTCSRCGKSRSVARNKQVPLCNKCKVKTTLTEEVVQNFSLPVVALTDTGAPSLDAKRAIPEYLATLDGVQLEFVRALASTRKYDKAVESMVSYEKFGRPYLTEERKLDLCFNPPPDGATFKDFEDFIVLHPSNNQTATKTLRTSQQCPNGQQVNKQEASCPVCNPEADNEDIDPTCWKCHGTGIARVSIRTMFCPAPGREWWSADFENLELRIPAYKAPEPAMIALFERPGDAPYFGSNHLLVAHKLHPRLFEACRDKGGQLDGRIFKKRYKDTWYQYLKNGNFAIQYGCQEELADRTFRVPGAFKMLKSAFAGMAALNQKVMAEATKYRYVKTALGYPLMVQRTEYGRPTPTQPLSYYVQGTAMECTRIAMPRCRDYLREVNAKERGGYHMVLLVHDELVFDFPYRPNMGNLVHALELRRIMCSSGDDIGVPLTVNVEYHRESWGKGETVKVAA